MSVSVAPSILVVEDNPVTRKLLRVTLEIAGYAVAEAPDGRTALAAAADRVPELVLQDLVLPDVDGLELRQALLALPGMADVPIVALSGFAGQEEVRRASQAGFTAVLTKPIEPHRLVESLRKLVPVDDRTELPVGAGRRILVVDDDPTQLKLTRIHLTHLGFIVRTAASATDALRAARLDVPDAILSDALMPDVDGFQLCFEVRSDPKLARVPFVLVSAHYQGDADRNLARRVGASALVLKSPDFAPAILRAIHSGAPLPSEQPSDRVRLEHAQAVIRQLDRQLTLSSGLARRCSLQAAQLSLLGGVAEALSRRGDTGVALRDVLAATLDATAISKGALFLTNRQGVLHLAHGIGFTFSEESALRSFFGQLEFLQGVLERKAAISIPSPGVPEQIARSVLTQGNVAHAEILPLVSDGRGVGALVLCAKRTDVTSEESVAFARAIGNQIVQSLELQASFARLVSSEQHGRILMESANDAICLISSDGIIREANRRTVELLGVQKSEIVGRHVRDFAVHESGTLARSPVELKRPDGTTVMVEFSGTPVVMDGSEFLLTIARDVTERLRAQSQLMVSDRMASIGALAASVAHEMNNPLAAVVSNLDLMTGDLVGLRAQLGSTECLLDLEHQLDDAREAASRVRTIVQDLRLLSRGEDDACGPVDVHHVLDSALRMASNEIRHRARLVKAYGEVPPVLVNEARLGQVFLNLVVNAAQAIADGDCESNEIVVRTRVDPTGRVVVEVADTGQGMSPAVQKQLFTPFFTTKAREIGTGLGLAICHRLVTAMGGEITVESELGRGTTVRVVLPCASTEVRTPSTPAAPIRAARRGRVMIVDDDRIVGNTLGRIIKREHEVTAVTSAKDALERITGGERFDVILCDVMMPVMTGIELHEELLATAPDQAARMVFLTGGAFTPRSQSFLSEIKNVRLEKPFDNQKLRAVVNGMLQ